MSKCLDVQHFYKMDYPGCMEFSHRPRKSVVLNLGYAYTREYIRGFLGGMPARDWHMLNFLGCETVIYNVQVYMQVCAMCA